MDHFLFALKKSVGVYVYSFCTKIQNKKQTVFKYILVLFVKNLENKNFKCIFLVSSKVLRRKNKNENDR